MSIYVNLQKKLKYNIIIILKVNVHIKTVNVNNGSIIIIQLKSSHFGD